MPPKKASDYFHGKEGYNCAQAVLKAFEEEHNISSEMIEEYRANGGGRAENGLCGALYAALNILNNPEKTALLKQAFLEKAGAIHCSEILALENLPCPGCVDLAAKIVSETT